jgi:hemolysin III
MAPPITPAWGLRNPFSSLSHYLGFVAAWFVAGLLVRLAQGDAGKRWSVACFGLSMCLLYFASGTYHALLLTPKQLWFFQMLDHTAIYLLIAGTYTPACVVLLRGPMRAGMLGLVWGLAALGIACKWLLELPPFWLTAGLYVGLGWTGMLVIGSLYRAIGVRGMIWVGAGGASYTLGAVLDTLQKPVLWPGVFGAHELHHVLVLTGTAAHVGFILYYVIPYHPKPAPAAPPVVARPAPALAEA